MKKLFLFAATAMLFAACTSEDVVAPQTGQLTADDGAVGFDVYVPGATAETRAGQAGTMTTNRLQRTEANGGGFGVYAYLVEDANDGATATDYVTWNRDAVTKNAPNFMVNEKILWNATNQGWYYSPLKYWPNETNNDSQTTPAWMQDVDKSAQHLDRLTFFAYAPYVATADASNPGITYVTNNKGKLAASATGSEIDDNKIEASIGYKATLNQPSASVDLLWGVAPSGGLNYTAVNGTTVSVGEGEPLIDMIKPDVNTSMKFLFQHALARIGINVVAAIDQIGAGGELDANTKITINEVTLTGKFGETGILNLDNPNAGIANWVKINSDEITTSTKALTDNKTLVLSVANSTINPNLCYTGPHTFGSYAAQTVGGVTTSKQDLIAGRYYTLDNIPAYTPTKQYYSNATGTVAVATYTVQASDNMYTLASNVYTQKTGSINAPDYPATMTNYYKVVEGATVFDGNNELSAAVYYTKASAIAYNRANVLGAVDNSTGLTAAEATAYNTAMSASKSADDVLSEDEAYDYNCTLPGAKTTLDIETPATYGYDDVTLTPATQLYTRTGSEGSYIYTLVGTKGDITWELANVNKYYTITPTQLAANKIDFAYAGTIYDVERNYFMVIPTNNVEETYSGSLTPEEDLALRTIRVKIEYYITTEDGKVNGGRTQTKNVIEKDVVFPSFANGKSYMLNLVLGLTSVKVEAEVGEWQLINVNADLPQNTTE